MLTIVQDAAMDADMIILACIDIDTYTAIDATAVIVITEATTR